LESPNFNGRNIRSKKADQLGQVGDEIHLYVVPATNLLLLSSLESQEISISERDGGPPSMRRLTGG
jgi:hypothetical protein